MGFPTFALILPRGELVAPTMTLDPLVAGPNRRLRVRSRRTPRRAVPRVRRSSRVMAPRFAWRIVRKFVC